MATKPVMFRFPEELIARLDQHVARELAKNPGYKITRSDVVRNFLEVMLREQDPEPDDSRRDAVDDGDGSLTEEERAYWGLTSPEKPASPKKTKKKSSGARSSRVKK